MKRAIFIVLLLFLTSCSTAHVDEEKETLFISAAISLTDVLLEIKEIYEKETGISITFNFGGTGSLAQQIEQGAPVHVFMSANEKWLERLSTAGHIDLKTRIPIASNELVLITNERSPLTYTSFEQIDHTDFQTMAIGNPDTVPVGQYTKEIFMQLYMWEKIEDTLVFAKDVRQVLTYVETNNADIGVVYKSDALTSTSINILAHADQSMHEPIMYSAAMTEQATNMERAQQFLDFMQTEKVQRIFEKYGFNKVDVS